MTRTPPSGTATAEPPDPTNSGMLSTGKRPY